LRVLEAVGSKKVFAFGNRLNYVKEERYLKLKGKSEKLETGGKTVGAKKGGFSKLLFHDDIYYQMGGFLILGLVVFFISWAIFAFGVKKSGLFADTFVVQKLFKVEAATTIGPWGAKTFGKTWHLFGKPVDVAKTVGLWGNVSIITFKYFFNYLIFVFVFIFLFNLVKIGRWNLGMIYYLLLTVMWGAVVGTNSMSFPAGDNQLVGSLLLFGRYGVWNWFAYLMLILSTSQFAWVVAPKWLGSEWHKVRAFWPVKFTPEQREIFLFGLLFLLAASFAEARIFVHYNLL
jgi:hypothetical protein